MKGEGRTVNITKKEMTGKSIAVGIGIGTVVSFVISLLLAALVTSMIAREKINDNLMNNFSLGIHYAAALAGAICAYRITRSKCMLVTGITSVAYLLLMSVTAIVFFDGISSSVWTSILAVGVGFLSACTVCISGGEKRRKRKRSSR